VDNVDDALDCGSEADEKLESAELMEEVSSEVGDAGGVSSAERIESGVVGLEVAIGFAKVKIGDVEVGGVGGSVGRIREGGKGARDNTVAIR